jgi:hypothetical protein
MSEKRVTASRVVTAALFSMACLALPLFAQQSKTVTRGPIVIQEFKHDEGPLLREVAPLLPEFSAPIEREIENHVAPRQQWSKRFQGNRAPNDEVLQRAENSPSLQTPNFNLEFDGLGYGDSFFCNCMPPDNDGAPGTTQYVQYINTTYAVYDKSGNMVLGPLNGNSFWSGFGGACESDDSGDPIVRFDAAAQRWVVAQFALNTSAPDYECIAVSKTADATGAYYRYAFPLTNLPDYPKLGVWPDAYYLTFNNFTIVQGEFVGADACAADRANMLAGNAATMQCFQQNLSQYSLLPSDLDGAIPPAVGTPNFFVELDPLGSADLDMFKFHVDFTTPANSTFTGPTEIPVAAFAPLCPATGYCVTQPTTGSDVLEGLGDRLMYRLVYRNFGDHTTLLVSHAVQSGSGGGARWYEIRNPETTHTVFQSGTFAPDSQFRWMPAIAMDQNQDIAVGFSRSGPAAGQYPSLVYAGRVPGDPAGTLESEVVLKAGAASQTSPFARWGDYSSLAVDPTDDCTFWFTEEYLKAAGQNSGFNWSTAIGTFSFPGCSTAAVPSFSLSVAPNAAVSQGGSSAPSTITVVPANGFVGGVTLSASGLPSGVTAAFGTNPTTSTSTLTFKASATAATGTVTVTITGKSGSLTSTSTVSLTVAAGSPVVSLAPTSLTWNTITVGVTGSAKVVTVTNTGSLTLNIANITISGDFSRTTVNKSCASSLLAGANCKIAVNFAPTQTGVRTGTLSIYDNASNSPQTVALSGTGGAQATLTPVSATYPARAKGTSSPAKVFTFTNHLNAPLSVSISANGDFSVSATTCGTSVPAAAHCSISVVFTPTQTGTRTGILSVSDSANNSPQTSSLTGTGK